MAVLKFFSLLFLGMKIYCGKNVNVTIEELCYESKDISKNCRDESCDIILQFFVESKEIKSSESLTGEIYRTTYQVENKKGFCKNLGHDTRMNLSRPMVYQTSLAESYLYVRFMRQSRVRTREEIEVLQSKIEPILNTTKYLMDDFYLHSEYDQNIKLKFIATMKCAQGYYGDKCEIYCVNVPSHFVCDANGFRICSNGFSGRYCNQRNETNNEKCSENNYCKCGKHEGIMECSHTDCPKEVNGCGLLRCTLNLITLNEICVETSVTPKSEGIWSPANMHITMPVTFLSIIIAFLLIVIFVMAICKRRRLPFLDKVTSKYFIPRRSETTGVMKRRMDIPLPQVTSYIDDYMPPNSDYADLRSQCQSQGGSISTYQYMSLPVQAPPGRVAH